jgi:lysozyme family protein
MGYYIWPIPSILLLECQIKRNNMTLFESCLEDVLALEGRYSDDGHDSGGRTKFGITFGVARAFGYKGLMIDLPIETATEIYKSRYWDKADLNVVGAYDPRIAKEVFEAGVNCGIRTSAKWLQQAINILRVEKLIAEDGYIGVKTLRALYARKKELDKVTILKLMNVYQANHYLDICKIRNQKRFIRGWFKRVSFRD